MERLFTGDLSKMSSEIDKANTGFGVGVFNRVEIRNDDGKLIMSLSPDHFGKDPEIRMYTSDGDEILVIFARVGDDSGVSILSPQGQVKVSMCSSKSTHGIVVYNAKGELVHEAIVDGEEKSDGVPSEDSDGED